MHFIIWLIIGGLAGWIAGLIVKGAGYGIIADIIIGIIGAFIAGWLLPRLGIHIGTGNAYLNQGINAVIGAVILLVVIGLIHRAF